MKANLAVAKEQLLNYETMEKEIDDAIVSIGKGEASSDNVYL